MKKRWLIVSLLVLVIQSLTPLVALAEVVNAPEKTISEVQLVTMEVEQTTPEMNEAISIKLRLNAKTHDAVDNTLSLSGFSSDSSNKELIINGNGEEIGWYQGQGNQVLLHFNEQVEAQPELIIQGKLTDTQVLNQTVSVSLNQQSLSQNVVLKDTSKPEETEESTDVPKEETTETTTVETKEEVKKEKANREPRNIEELLNGAAFFKDVTLKKVENETTEIDVDKTTLLLEDIIKLNMNFMIEESVREQMIAGDYYKVQLPKEIGIYTPIEKELEPGEDGISFGSFVVDTSGELTITFNKNVEDKTDIKGNIFIESSLQQGSMTTVGDNKISFPFVENSPEFDVYIRPKTETTISKEGHLNRVNNPSEITWHVDVNLDYATHTNMTITESFPEGTSFKSVEVKELLLDFEGNVIGEGQTLPVSNYTVSSDGRQLVFNEPVNKAYRLIYHTKIEDNSKPGDKGGIVSYQNTAGLTSKEQTTPLEATSTITAMYKRMLEKELVNYDPDNQFFNWRIKYNHIEATIPASKAVIHDVFDGNMSLNKTSLQVKAIEFDEDGNQLSDGRLLTEGQDYTLVESSTGKGFDIKFLKDLTYAVNIDYQTKVNDEIHDDEANHVYANRVTDGNGNTSEDEIEAYQRSLAKWYTDLDYSQKTVDWHIRLNTNRYEMNGFKLEDTMSPGLTILEENSSMTRIRDFTAGTTLKEGIDYNFVYDDVKGTFSIEFIGDYIKTDHVFEITYTTEFDTPTLNEAGKQEFLNKVKGTWKSKDGIERENHAQYGFTPIPEEGADGFKHGNYNAKTKEIEWKIGINYNREKLGNTIIRDELQGNQVYVPGSLRAYRYTIGSNGEVIPGKRLPDEEFKQLFTITEPTKKQLLFAPQDPITMSNELKIEIKDVKKEDQYFVVFNTTLANQIIHKDNQYDNTAYIQADGVEGEFKIEGKVSIANGDSFVQKGGYQNSEGFVQWSAKINPSQSTIYKPVVTDKPSSNQSIQKDSIALYEMEVDERGNLRKGQLVPKEEYHVNITTNEATYEQELQLTFDQDKIDRAYLLEYQTALFLENGSGEYASNNISLEGNNQEIVRQSTTESIFVRMSSGGGSATGQQSRVIINKKSDTGELLSDTVFELWDKNGTRKIDEKVTNEEGIVVFDKIPIGTYLLKETKAKEGYEISDELKKGKLIKVDRLTATGVEQIHLENKKIVPKTSLTVTKAWKDGDNQDGKRPVFVEVQLKKNAKNEG
ncbi:MAG: collagen binding domain-containing protein, partial [Vagococcus sp.]